MAKLIEVKLNRTHEHGGEVYKAGSPIKVSEKRREFFRIRGMLAEPVKTTQKKKKDQKT